MPKLLHRSSRILNGLCVIGANKTLWSSGQRRGLKSQTVSVWARAPRVTLQDVPTRRAFSYCVSRCNFLGPSARNYADLGRDRWIRSTTCLALHLRTKCYNGPTSNTECFWQRAHRSYGNDTTAEFRVGCECAFLSLSSPSRSVVCSHPFLSRGVGDEH